MFTLYIYSNCTLLNGQCIFFENHQKLTEKKTSDMVLQSFNIHRPTVL